MTCKISMNVTSKTDRQVQEIVAQLGLSSATDAYAKSVATLHKLISMDPDKKGVRIIQPDGQVVRLVIL